MNDDGIRLVGTEGRNNLSW